MKKIMRSYGSFSRTERIGILALLGLLLVLMVVRVTMRYWAAPQVDAQQEASLIAAWGVYERSKPAVPTTPKKIDLNTADSATLVTLKGIGPVTAHNIIVSREEDGLFTDIEELKELGRFSGPVFDSLRVHLIISDGVGD